MVASIHSKLSDYELQRLERIKRNREVMEQLGLIKAAKVVRKAARPVPRMPSTGHLGKRKEPPSGEPVKLRRSGRSAGSVQYTTEDLYHIKMPKRVRQSRATSTVELTTDQRKKLEDAEDWLEDMHDFLLNTTHGRNGSTISQPNANTVMRQVRILVSGSGVAYRHWDEGTIFAAGRAVTLATDFVALFNEAVEFEDAHGRDRGNGWLLRHPITKLLCYQLHKYQNTEETDGNGDCDGDGDAAGNVDTQIQPKASEECKSSTHVEEEVQEAESASPVTVESASPVTVVSDVDPAVEAVCEEKSTAVEAA